MPVHWQEQEKQEVKRHGSSKISNETPSNASLGPPETRLGTADWRAFVREVHLQQKERKVLLMNASYLPNINRYVTFLFYLFAGRVKDQFVSPQLDDDSSTTCQDEIRYQQCPVDSDENAGICRLQEDREQLP